MSQRTTKNLSECGKCVAYSAFLSRMPNVAGPFSICFPSPNNLALSSCKLVCQTFSTTPPGPSRSEPDSARVSDASHWASAVAVADWRLTRTKRVRSERRRSQVSSEPMLEPV